MEDAERAKAEKNDKKRAADEEDHRRGCKVRVVSEGGRVSREQVFAGTPRVLDLQWFAPIYGLKHG